VKVIRSKIPSKRVAAAIAGAILALVCGAWGLGRIPSARAAEPNKPNIIFVLTDDLAMNLVQYMPNVVAMQREGMTFSNYFVTDSLCCPSRSSIFTGKFPHNTKVLTNGGSNGGFGAFMANGNEPVTFAVALQNAGYSTAMLGKYLNGYHPRKNPPAKGWTEWDVAGDAYKEFNYVLNQNGRSVRYGNKPEDYLVDVEARIADAFVRKSAQQPFFIEIATFAPHAPYIPAPRDADKFPGLTAPRGPAYGARPDANAPRWLKAIPPLRPVDRKRIDTDFRMRVQAVQAVDQMIGTLRATLTAIGVTNTYIVFSSDNGLHMGEYSLRPGKQTPFDTDIHVPLIVVGPGIPQGVVASQIVENVDLHSTFAELAGTSPIAADGRSLVPILRGGAVTDWRRMALIEHHRNFPDPTDPDAPIQHAADPTSYAALRLEGALYVEYEDGEVGYYDLRSDPSELKNVAPSLPSAKHQRLHDIITANKACLGSQACWNAQGLAP